MNKNKLSEDPYEHIIINNIKLDWIDKNIYQLCIFSSVCQQSSSSFHTQHVGLKGIFSCCFFMRKPWRPPPTLRMRFSGATGWWPPRRRCLTFFSGLTSSTDSEICCSLNFCSNSFNPTAMVLREAPVAFATLDIPPQPRDFASAAKYNRYCFSPSSPTSKS